MQTFRSITIGIVYGVVSSLLFSFTFVLFGQGAAGGFTMLFSEFWLYIATLPVFTLGFMVLGYIFSKNTTFSKKASWIYSSIIAFIVTFYLSTIGSLIAHHILYPDGMGIYERYIYFAEFDDNIFYWGLVYSIVLLPLTTIITRYLITFFAFIVASSNRKTTKASA